jgi:hypothetical protein
LDGSRGIPAGEYVPTADQRNKSFIGRLLEAY